jgi:cobyrinic acid a,c-diamide synthase
MCDVIEAHATMTGRLTLGYLEATATGAHPIWPAGDAEIRGHEFHYSRVDPAAGETAAWRLRHGDVTEEGHVAGAVHASYLYTHWAATPEVARRLVAIAASAREVAA